MKKLHFSIYVNMHLKQDKLLTTTHKETVFINFQIFSLTNEILASTFFWWRQLYWKIIKTVTLLNTLLSTYITKTVKLFQLFIVLVYALLDDINTLILAFLALFWFPGTSKYTVIKYSYLDPTVSFLFCSIKTETFRTKNFFC